MVLTMQRNTIRIQRNSPFPSLSSKHSPSSHPPPPSPVAKGAQDHSCHTLNEGQQAKAPPQHILSTAFKDLWLLRWFLFLIAMNCKKNNKICYSSTRHVIRSSPIQSAYDYLPSRNGLNYHTYFHSTIPVISQTWSAIWLELRILTQVGPHKMPPDGAMEPFGSYESDPSWQYMYGQYWKHIGNYDQTLLPS